MEAKRIDKSTSLRLRLRLDMPLRYAEIHLLWISAYQNWDSKQINASKMTVHRAEQRLKAQSP